jgi:hypothetical protein
MNNLADLYALLLERILEDERQELQERKLVGAVTSPRKIHFPCLRRNITADKIILDI